jgi:hypothetical protein
MSAVEKAMGSALSVLASVVAWAEVLVLGWAVEWAWKWAVERKEKKRKSGQT